MTHQKHRVVVDAYIAYCETLIVWVRLCTKWRRFEACAAWPELGELPEVPDQTLTDAHQQIEQAYGRYLTLWDSQPGWRKLGRRPRRSEFHPQPGDTGAFGEGRQPAKTNLR